MIEKAEAIVLKSRKYGDASKIITLYTKEFGKITVIAKGSRSKNNRFGGSLEPMSYISIVFYKYSNRELQYISQSSIINFFPRIHDDLSKMMVAMAILEIVNNVVHSEEQNKGFFILILNIIQSLEESKSNFDIFLIYFQVHLARIFGFQPNFNTCEICNNKLNENYLLENNGFIIDRGQVICQQCQGKLISTNIKISLSTIRIIQKLTSSEPHTIENIHLQHDILVNIFNLMHKYLMHHLTGMKNLKSIEIFSKFK